MSSRGDKKKLAQEAFAEYLRRREEGEALDFEAFCGAPEIADALRVLFSLRKQDTAEV